MELTIPLPRLTRTLWRIHHRQKHISKALQRFRIIATCKSGRHALLRVFGISRFTNNPCSIMKPSYNFAIVSDGSQTPAASCLAFLMDGIFTWFRILKPQKRPVYVGTEGAPLDHDRDWRFHRHRSFVALAQRFLRRARWGAASLYILIGPMVYFLMTSLGESWRRLRRCPVFCHLRQNYVEEGFGFALGWNYWYNW